jgi:hypothetical protein
MRQTANWRKQYNQISFEDRFRQDRKWLPILLALLFYTFLVGPAYKALISSLIFLTWVFSDYLFKYRSKWTYPTLIVAGVLALFYIGL